MGNRRDRRPLIFLGVLILHGAVVLLLVRASHELRAPLRSSSEPLLFLFLHKDGPAETPASAPAPAAAAAPVARPVRRRRPAAPMAESNAITVPAETDSTTKTDWDHETQMAVQTALANAGKERDYRNLSGLSAAQLKFVRDNHLVPMAPGIVWARPRVEVVQGIPIIHINDHCVLILLLPLCSVGHITPNSHLFDDLHHAAEP
jgi:hypothetical protein